MLSLELFNLEICSLFVRIYCMSPELPGIVSFSRSCSPWFSALEISSFVCLLNYPALFFPSELSGTI